LVFRTWPVIRGQPNSSLRLPVQGRLPAGAFCGWTGSALRYWKVPFGGGGLEDNGAGSGLNIVTTTIQQQQRGFSGCFGCEPTSLFNRFAAMFNRLTRVILSVGKVNDKFVKRRRKLWISRREDDILSSEMRFFN
jgi:hypothetical protein